MGAQNGPIDGPSMGHGKKVGGPSMGHRWECDGPSMAHGWAALGSQLGQKNVKEGPFGIFSTLAVAKLTIWRHCRIFENKRKLRILNSVKVPKKCKRGDSLMQSKILKKKSHSAEKDRN